MLNINRKGTKLERREVKIAKCVKKDRELKKTNRENLTEYDEKMKNKSDRKRKGQNPRGRVDSKCKQS